MNGKKVKFILGGLALAVFGTLGLMNFKQSMTPYVTFAEAVAAERAVQVAGFPNHQDSGFDNERGLFWFTMKNEDGEQMKVVHRGGKPGNFDQAQSVVVIGNYRNGEMDANQILVKCPSKYEAEGIDHPGAENMDASPATSTTTSTTGY